MSNFSLAAYRQYANTPGLIPGTALQLSLFGNVHFFETSSFPSIIIQQESASKRFKSAPILYLDQVKLAPNL